MDKLYKYKYNKYKTKHRLTKSKIGFQKVIPHPGTFGQLQRH